MENIQLRGNGTRPSVIKTKLRCFLLLIILALNVSGSYSQNGLTLEEALKTAETNSPTLKKVRLSLVQSQENLNAQKAALKSSFSLSVNPISYSQNRDFNELISQWNTTKITQSYGLFTIAQPILLTDASISLVNKFGYTDSYSEYSGITTKGFNNDLSLNISQPLFTYNTTKLELKELELTLEYSQLSYAIQLLTLENSVTESFYEVYQAQQTLQIDKEAYDNMQKSYKISKNKAEAGLAERDELYQAEINLSSAKLSYETSQVSFENVKDEFKLLIGISLYDDLMVLPDISTDTVNVDIAFAIEQGLKNRMELRQQQITIEYAKDNLIEKKALNEFKGSLDLSVGLFGDNENMTNVYSNPTDNEAIELSLTIPLWDWGEKKSRIKAAQAYIESANVELEEEKSDIILDIRASCRSLINLINQIETTRKNVGNSQLTYDLNLEKYKNGNLSGLDLSNYQNQLSENKLAYTNSIISYKLELLNLKILSLYDFEKKQQAIQVNTMINDN